MKRGDLYMVDFSGSGEGEPSGYHPAVIVSSDAINDSRISAVILMPVSSTRRPRSVLIASGIAGLETESWANPAHLVTVNRDRFRHSFRGSLPPQTISEIDAALGGALGL